MSGAHPVRAESWDEARDWRRFWWILPPLTFVLITLSMAWLTGFRNDGGQPELESLSEQFFLNSATGPTPQITVQNVEGDITVTGQDGGAVSIEITRRGFGRTASEAKAALATLRLFTQEDGPNIRILPAQDQSPVLRRVRADITLRVPRAASLELHTLRGRVTVSGVNESLSIRNASGDIEVTLTDGPFTLEAEAIRLMSSFPLEGQTFPSAFSLAAQYGNSPSRLLQLSASRGTIILKTAEAR